MRRKPGTLLPIERSLLEAALELRQHGEAEFHGYAIAKVIRDLEDARRLTAHGTLYRALDRLLQAGLLEADWEDPEIAAAERRPRRKLYRLTALGERIGASSTRAQAPSPSPLRRGVLPS